MLSTPASLVRENTSLTPISQSPSGCVLRTLLAAALLGSTVAPALAGPGKDNPFGGRRVLVIGIDGCRADVLRTLANDGRAPSFAGLIREGTVTWNAFAGGVLETDTQQDTVSGPGWTTVLTGVWRDRHAVFDNRFRIHRIAQNPHFLRRIEDAAPTAWTGSLSSWPEIHKFIVGASRSGDTAFLDHEYQPDHKSPDGKHTDYEKCDADIRDRAIAQLRTADPDALFVYFGHLDEVGHGVAHKEGRFSVENAPYCSALAQIDSHVGQIVAAVRARPKYAEENWLILATTDHGGRDTKHGGQTPEERTIWMVAQGGDAPKGKVVSDLIPQTAFAPAILHHLRIPIASDWGWESRPFALPASPK